VKKVLLLGFILVVALAIYYKVAVAMQSLLVE